MNTDVAGASPVEREVRALQRYCDADDALVYHERPFYAACAGRGHFERTAAWEQRRAELTREWYAANLAAFGRPVPQKRELGLFARISAWLRPNV